MRVLIAFDKFKDALGARQACDAAARALRSRHPDWQLDPCPLSDGGDGFLDVLAGATGCRKALFPVTGPRGGTVEAPVGLVPFGKVPAAAMRMLDLPERDQGTLAIVEMASASGLALLPPELRDPWQATSHGTGQLIRAAAELGATAVLLGVGGSATHDLGFGALCALGLEFRTDEGRMLRPPFPAQWPQIGRIEGEVFASIPPIRIACDVSNPLLGPRGTAAVYGPQKGLAPGDLERLEAATSQAANRLLAHCGKPAGTASVPGSGAAGGIAFGLMAAAGARLVPGFALVSAWLDIGSRIAAADLVLTGEGRFDASSGEGKGPGAVVALALSLGKPVHVFAGRMDGPPEKDGGARLHPITPPETPEPEALRRTAANLAAAIQRAF